MKTNKIFCALMLSLLLNQQANAGLVNGSFETGDYFGWTLFEDSDLKENGTWGIARSGDTIHKNDSTFDFYDRVYVTQEANDLPLTYVATDGNFLAYQLQNGVQAHRMYQDLTLDRGPQTLSWDMLYNNRSASFDLVSQFITIQVLDTSDNLLATLFRTYEGDALSTPMTSYSADISAFAGQTIRLDVTMMVKANYLDAAYDNFKITNVVPLPASAWLFGGALAGLFGFTLKKSSTIAL